MLSRNHGVTSGPCCLCCLYQGSAHSVTYALHAHPNFLCRMLRKDKEEAEAIKHAKALEEEKAMYSVRSGRVQGVKVYPVGVHLTIQVLPLHLGPSFPATAKRVPGKAAERPQDQPSQVGYLSCAALLNGHGLESGARPWQWGDSYRARSSWRHGNVSWAICSPPQPCWAQPQSIVNSTGSR